MTDPPTEADFRANLTEMVRLEREQAALFAAILADLEDPRLRALFEQLRRDETDHAASLEKLSAG